MKGEGTVIRTELNLLRSYKASTCRAMKSTFFNTKVVPVGIDSCASATVGGVERMFIGKIEPVTGVHLHGVGGSIPIIGKGTMRIIFEDDDSNSHEHRIRDAYYAPRLKLTLLSTRQWSNQGPKGRNHQPLRSATFRGDQAILHLENNKVRTIDIEDGEEAIPILETKPGHNAFSTFVMTQHLSANEALLRPTALPLDNLKLPDAVGERYRQRGS